MHQNETRSRSDIFPEFSNGQASGSSTSSNTSKRNKKTRPTNIIVMRHSERVDDCLPGWIEKSSNDGKYLPYDINMPNTLPIDRPLKDFTLDTPITVSGKILARMIGRSLDTTNLKPDVIYCSPSLRCIETAMCVKQMCGSEAMLRIEPSLFENLSLYPNGFPVFPTEEQLKFFPVDETYVPLLTVEELVTKNEQVSRYNYRIQNVLRRIVKFPEFQKKESTVLIVGHASTVDMAVGLLRSEPRLSSEQELKNIGDTIPYCSTILLQKKGNNWEPNFHTLPFITNGVFTNRFDHQFLLRKL